jgi:hypothetical protein
VLLLVFIIVGSSFSTAHAHYDAKIEIYKAITIPVIDGTYNMTMNDVTIDGKKVRVDEWNDAAWVQVRAMSGNVTAYSGYKFDGQFLYIVYDVHDTRIGGVLTEFDPRHDGVTSATKWDNFMVSLDLWMKMGADVAFPQRSSQYWFGCCDKCSPCRPGPEGLIGNASIGPSPLLSAPHQIYELRLPLRASLSYGKYALAADLGGTFGMLMLVEIGREAKDGYNAFPPNVLPLHSNNTVYADATFSKSTNPSVTVPPTVVPELPIRAAPLVIVATLVAFVLISKKKLGVFPHRDTQIN